MTEEELNNVVRELGRWQAQKEYIKFGRTWYGPHVVKLHIHTDSEYDDQGGYDDYVSGVTAYDMLGHELPIDHKSAGVDTGEVEQHVKRLVEKYNYDEEDARQEVLDDYRRDDLSDLDVSFVKNYGYEIHIPTSGEEPQLPPIYVEETFDANNIRA